MKKLFIIIVLSFFTSNLFAQEKTLVNTSDDWSQVKIITSDDISENLTEGEEIKAISYYRKGKSGQQYLIDDALKKLKKIAASKGYEFVVITKSYPEGISSKKLTSHKRQTIAGTGYAYQ